jgi:hypothetical protein
MIQLNSIISILLIALIGCAPPSVLIRTDDYYYFGRPTSHWYVEIPTAKYTVFTYQTFNGGISGIASIRRTNHPRTEITFKVEPANEFKNAVECRDFYFRIPFGGMKRIAYEKNGIAFIEMGFDELILSGHLVTAYYFRDGDMLTINIYTEYFNEDKDRHLIFELFDSIKFLPRENT